MRKWEILPSIYQPTVVVEADSWDVVGDRLVILRDGQLVPVAAFFSPMYIREVKDGTD